ncbi:MAG: RecQ family ATP-dependent DNA helicase [Bacteroidales bacterium]|nr:RecQ family ATP-dependent DNA helicase [Bacteroidales bacterium]
MTIDETLKKYWGYDSFRPLQREIIDSVLAGNDTMTLLPTGGGKSICYQLPALMKDGITLVVSPLIALMKDQVTQLRSKHITAAAIYSGLHQHEIEAILNNCVFGKIKILYVSPERLQSRTFVDHLRQMPLSLLAVDEAHCISQWGYDFRPPYLEISSVRQYHPDVPIIALTATATPEVVSDIERQLQFRNTRLFQSSFSRPNLSYSVRRCDDKQGLLLRIIKNVGGSGIVYVRNRRRTVEIANMLNDKNIAAAAYHAGISIKERDERQKAWTESRQGVMVATNAFGMGIDKPDVRFVVHLDLPESPEAYFQEAGRAGRDGKKAYAVLLCNDGDQERLLGGLDTDYPELNYIKNVYRAICNYYQIPVGAGLDSRFDFELEKICNSYGLDYKRFFSSLKFLEREGLISLPDHSELQSKLFIPINKEELYRFQVSNKQAGDMMTTILRLYGGLFTDFTPISEQLIARRCGVAETQVHNTLFELNRLGIVYYQPKTIKPQIVFCTPRLDIKDIHISDQNYRQLRDAEKRRREAIIEYANNSSRCRSQWLINYFGEKRDQSCGLCDICIEQRKKGAKENHEDEIMQHLAATSMNIKQLSATLPQIKREVLVEAVRSMLDRKLLEMDDGLIKPCHR